MHVGPLEDTKISLKVVNNFCYHIVVVRVISDCVTP
jgi:hypothetical protein